MSDLDLSFTPATELARRIATKEMSPVEIVQNSLDRIEEINPALNCFCFVFPDEALDKVIEQRQVTVPVCTYKPVQETVQCKGSRGFS